MKGTIIMLIALTAITALGGMSQAADFELTGEVEESIEVTAPTVTSQVFDPGEGSWIPNGYIGLSTNSDSWSVMLKSDKAKMTSKSTSADTLTNSLRASASFDGSNAITLGTSDATLTSGSAASATPIALYINQTVSWTDKPHDDYSMNITITGSVT